MLRSLIGLLFLATFSLLPACQSPSETETIPEATPVSFDRSTETAAIMSAIEAETACFFARDYDCWKQHWVPSESTFQAWTNSDGSFDASNGWAEVDTRVGTYIRENPLEPGATTTHPKVERRNLIVDFLAEDVAYLIWDQYNQNTTSDSFRHSKELRLMKKEADAWKILNITALWDYTRTVEAGSAELAES